MSNEETINPVWLNDNPFTQRQIQDYQQWRMNPETYDLVRAFKEKISAMKQHIERTLKINIQDEKWSEIWNAYRKEVYLFCLETIRENLAFPNPYATGCANYSNMDKKRQHAHRILGKALIKLQYAEKQLIKQIRDNIASVQKPVMFNDFSLLKTEMKSMKKQFNGFTIRIKFEGVNMIVYNVFYRDLNYLIVLIKDGNILWNFEIDMSNMVNLHDNNHQEVKPSELTETLSKIFTHIKTKIDEYYILKEVKN